MTASAPVLSTRPSLARRGALSVGVLAVSLLSAELVVRALGLEPARYAETRHLESGDKRAGLDLYPSNPGGRFPLDLREPTTRAAWTGRVEELDAWAERAPYAVPGHYSRELCRVAHDGDELPPRTAERPRVVLVGDSFIEGQGVSFEETVAARLATALTQTGLPQTGLPQTGLPETGLPETGLAGTDVLACGRRGYDFALDPEQEHGLSRWMLAHVLDADVMVYAMTLNDPARSEAFAARQSYVDDWIVDRRRMLAHDADPGASLWTPRLVTLLEDRIEALRIGRATLSWYRQMVEPPNAEGWSATLAQLAELAASLAHEGRELVIALWPLLAQLESGGAYPFAATHARIADDLHGLGLEVIDTLPAFVGADTESLWVHAVDHHPNAEGHRRFAEAIAPSVREALARSYARGDSASP